MFLLNQDLLYILVITVIITSLVSATAYAKTFLITEIKIVECDDSNITHCETTSTAKDQRELTSRKTFSVENPSTNVA